MSLQGRTIAIRGSVECVEDVLIEGRIEGHIWNENHVVTVGADAVVTGDIVARQITVRGAVEGTLMATGPSLLDRWLATPPKMGLAMEQNATTCFANRFEIERATDSLLAAIAQP